MRYVMWQLVGLAYMGVGVVILFGGGWLTIDRINRALGLNSLSEFLGAAMFAGVTVALLAAWRAGLEMIPNRNPDGSRKRE